jgi:hypothetical protein
MLQIFRSKYEHIFRYTIYGERHSGTNFLEQCFKQKFNLDLTYFYGFKHWMGFAKPERIAYDRHVLFTGIVRHPYDWIAAFYSLPHHVPKQHTETIERFLTSEWYSVDYHGKEIMQDRDYTTGNRPIRYRNIFHMRKEKCIYLSQIMPVLASNYILISYDSFLYNHKNYLNIIRDRFNLKIFGNPPAPIDKPKIQLDKKIKKIIDDNIDWSVEASLGYFPR